MVPGFVVQFGLPADPASTKKYSTIKDDPVLTSNVRGTVSFASAGPNTRSNQLFINLGGNANLDGMGFAPVGKVVSGMEFVDRIYSGYGEKSDQGKITRDGLKYLDKEFPKLSYVARAVPASEDVQAAVVVPQQAEADKPPQLRGDSPLDLAPGEPAPLPWFSVAILALTLVGVATLVRCWKKALVRGEQRRGATN